MIHHSRLVSASIVLAASAVVACGNSGSDAQTCASYSACGGNIVGNWTIDAECDSPAASTTVPAPIPTCLSATATTTRVFVSGTASFTADGKYTTTTTFSGNETITLPASCLMGLGNPTSCDALGAQLQSNAGDAGTTPTCTGTISVSCACTLTTTTQTTTTQGTYTTSGDQLNQNPAGSSGTPTTETYCVRGSSLGVFSILGPGFVAHM
jgi:hypothetical protein